MQLFRTSNIPTSTLQEAVRATFTQKFTSFPDTEVTVSSFPRDIARASVVDAIASKQPDEHVMSVVASDSHVFGHLSDASGFAFNATHPMPTGELAAAVTAVVRDLAFQASRYSQITLVPDFPKPNVLFQDVSSILADADGYNAVCGRLAEMVAEQHLDFTKVVGVDARGFIFGSVLAQLTKRGFVMCRKKGKLPGKTLRQKYGTEYSQDEVELLEGIVGPEDRVVIVDDLVATGGSLDAAIKLVKRAGANVAACMTVLQVPACLSTALDRLGEVPLHVMFNIE